LQKKRNKLNFLTFKSAFGAWPVTSVLEIEKAFPGFDRNALTRWQGAGYIEKIRNGYYRFTDHTISGDSELFFLANRLYPPSYVSLQSALSWYGFIPEGVFTVTSISTLKTQTINAKAGHFTYRNVKPDLFFGYRLENFGAYRFKIATPEKAILDLLYLQPELGTEDHFYELRLNFWEMEEQFRRNDFESYLAVFSSKALEKRAATFLKFLSSYDTIDRNQG
jgi:predicted transcriptional regulator of viral defense system